MRKLRLRQVCQWPGTQGFWLMFFPFGGSLPEEVPQNLSEEGPSSGRENLGFCRGSFLPSLCKPHNRHKAVVVKSECAGATDNSWWPDSSRNSQGHSGAELGADPPVEDSYGKQRAVGRRLGWASGWPRSCYCAQEQGLA